MSNSKNMKIHIFFLLGTLTLNIFEPRSTEPNGTRTQSGPIKCTDTVQAKLYQNSRSETSFESNSLGNQEAIFFVRIFLFTAFRISRLLISASFRRDNKNWATPIPKINPSWKECQSSFFSLLFCLPKWKFRNLLVVKILWCRVCTSWAGVQLDWEVGILQKFYFLF